MRGHFLQLHSVCKLRLYFWRVNPGNQSARAAVKQSCYRAFTKSKLGWDCDRREGGKVRALWAGEQPPAQPCDMTPAELAHRMKWLAREMDTVGSAMLTQAKSTGDAELRSAGWDLHDAASALLAEIKEKP